MNRLKDIFDHKRKSTEAFREVQARLGMINPEEIILGSWGTREGCIELHKGLHWINLEYSEFIGAKREEQSEELADVFHFLVEFCILFGYDEGVLPDLGEGDQLDLILDASKEDALVFPDPHTNARFAILANLQVAEMLKNKPWKQSLRLDLDLEEFRRRVLAMWYWFGAVVRTSGLSGTDIYNAFVRKEEINFKRISEGV